MKRAAQFYINGKWVKPAGQNTVPVYNPATNKLICQLSCANIIDIDLAVAAAKQAFSSFSKTSVKERYDLLRDINAELQKRNDEIAAAISIEMGAPIGLARNAQALSGPQHFTEILEVLESFKFENTTRSGTLIRREPIGVCALITPWNWPMNQIATKVAPAIAAGCTMVLKPSEIAPLSALILAEIMDDVGVPAGVFNLINGIGSDIGTHLTSHKDVDMISFTGSTRAGVAISHAAAPTIKRVALELGGKSAGIVTEEVNVERMAQQAINSSMLNTGQSCNALTRLLVPVSIANKVYSAIKIAVENLTVDLPENNPYMGPVASEQHFHKVQDFIRSGIEEGANLLCGGLGKPDRLEQGCFVKPTVFTHVLPTMTIAKEEIFGPVLCIMTYDDIQQALDIANSSEYGLSGYVWAGNDSKAAEIAKQMRTGMVHLNGKGLDSGAPFGGFKMSGNGREWGSYGLDEFLEYQSIYMAAEHSNYDK